MQATITAKIKLLPSEEQSLMLDRTMDAYRQACNYVSDYVYKAHTLTRAKIHEHTYRSIRDIFGLKSQMSASIIKTVIASYKTIRTNQKRWIKPCFRKPVCDFVWNKDYSLKPDCFALTTMDGRIKIPYVNKGMEKYFDAGIYKFGTATLIKKHGKYYLHIFVTFDVEDVDIKDIKNVVGVDRGINFLVATYDSHGISKFVSGKGVKNKRAHYKKLRQELHKRQTSSARRRLRAIGSRENRWMNDVNHCVSKALVEQNPEHTMFVLEDLSGVRNATERVLKKNRYVMVSWAYYDLEQKLKYKAMNKGQLVINVDPRYTSQTCPKCGCVDKGNRDKKLHLFTCKNCGYRSNDDRIGAMNLHRMGINYLSEMVEKVPDAVPVQQV